MGVNLLRPRVADLVFQVYGSALHPEFFDIVAERRIRREDYEVVVRITRAGHAMTWENRKFSLTEVTSTSDQDLPDHHLIQCRMRGEQSESLRGPGGISYQTSFQTEILPPEIFHHVHEEIRSDGGKRGLLHNFQPRNRLFLAPLGMVAVEARTGCIIITSFHTFPDQLTVVKSQSLIEKK